MLRRNNKWIGDRRFYAMVLMITVPIVIQNGITSFVNLLDNVMVGRIGTEQMSGVAIANQLIMVFEMSIFGGISGAGIFSAQFFGRGDLEGVRNTFRIKVIVGLAIAVLGIVIFLLFGDRLIHRFLQGSGDVGDAEATARYGLRYMQIILIGFIPFAMTQIYAGTLKETSETMLPMAASITAVLTNLVLNYILIYGKLGVPALGPSGAAIATVISRFVELGVVTVFAHRRPRRYRFVQGLYSSFRVPRALLGEVLRKGAPLLVNELLWSAGMAMLNQSYSLRGLSVVAAMNITSTISNLFYIVTMAMGNTVSILVGQALGSGDMERAQDTDRKLILFSVSVSAVMGCLWVVCSRWIPRIYNTEEAVRTLASGLMVVAACAMPINAFSHAAYFTLRSGGKTIITFLFDSGFTWVIAVPVAYVLSRFTAMPIIMLYAAVQASNLIKCVFGWVLVKKGVWLNNIVAG